MRLFIAEKPSVARALAAGLGRPSRGDGFLRVGEDVVTWAFGHLLEMAMPEHYDPALARWREQDLPIVPAEWKMRVKDDEGAKNQLRTIGRFLKEASEVVNAGDPDREGQLLVDEILEAYRYAGPVRRFWVSSQDEVAIRRGLEALRGNAEYKGFADAALARGRADWLIGMNLSRAFTLSARRSGARTLLTVGRVQTPTLAMVVARDREIEAFVPVSYITITGHFRHEGGAFKARWKPPQAAGGEPEAGPQDARQDDDAPAKVPEGRLTDPELAKRILSDVKGQTGTVTSFRTEEKSDPPPRPFSLASLTFAASKRWGYGAEDVLKAAQNLYEAKLVSYPRTDCEYLPESQHADAPAVLAAMRTVFPQLGKLVDRADPKLRSRAWNDEKVTAHHGMIPTQHRGEVGRLSEIEANLYQLVARTYLAQFYPPHRYLASAATVEVAGHAFAANGRVEVDAGWQAILKPDESKEKDEDDSGQKLPAMAEGDPAVCEKADKKEKKTKAPPRFTEGTLVRAMETVHKFVEDDDLKKLLKEEDGIGTPATRATIISELKRRGFLESRKKALVSTELGRSLVDALPEAVRSPVLTALFERDFKEIQAGTRRVEEFLERQTEFVREQVAAAGARATEVAGADLGEGPECPSCGKGRLRRVEGARGPFWSCSRWRADPPCKGTWEDRDGAPVLEKPEGSVACPSCGKGWLRRIPWKDRFFWGCTRYRQGCRASFEDREGRPDLPGSAAPAAPAPPAGIAAPQPRPERTENVMEAPVGEAPADLFG